MILLTLLYGTDVLQPNAKTSSGISAHPYVNCKVKTLIRSLKSCIDK